MRSVWKVLGSIGVLMIISAMAWQGSLSYGQCVDAPLPTPTPYPTSLPAPTPDPEIPWGGRQEQSMQGGLSAPRLAQPPCPTEVPPIVQPQPTAYVPQPTLRPRPTASVDENGCNTLSELSLGDFARVSDETPDPVPLRAGPAMTHQILMQVDVNEVFPIMGGPSCTGNFVWWMVVYEGNFGWMAEINGLNGRNLLLEADGVPVDECGPGWTPPTASQGDTEVWYPRPNFSIILTDLRVEESQHLTTLISAHWLNSLVEQGHYFSLGKAFEFVINWTGVVLDVGLSVQEVAELYFGGGVSNAHDRYIQVRWWREQAEQIATDGEICGNYIQVPLGLLNRGVTSFPNWWNILAEYVPHFHKQSICNQFPDTCSALGKTQQ